MSPVEGDSPAAAVPHRTHHGGEAPGDYQGRRSGLVTRTAANLIDFLVTLGVLSVLYLGVAAVKFIWNPRGFTFPAPSLAFAIIAGTTVAGIYFAVSWLATGRTYGDYVLGLRVVSGTGRRLRPGVAVLRALTCVICPIGLLWVAVSRSNQSLQDLLFRSRVVYDWSDTVPGAGRSLIRLG